MEQEYTKEELQEWLRAELKDLVADKKHIDESNMPLFNQGLDWVCALDTKVEKILNKLAIPAFYEALKYLTETVARLDDYTIDNSESYKMSIEALAKAESK